MSVEAPLRKKLKKNEVSHCPCCPNFQEWCETDTGKFNMPKGKYYVGDLAHVLPSELWNEIPNKPGKFTLSDGREVVSFMFEGCQPEKDNKTDFYIESGMIGTTILAGLNKTWMCHSKMFGGWGPYWNKLEAIRKTGKEITMMDYMTIAGTTVVYDTDFDCIQHTMSHYRHDDHSTTTYFGDKVSLWTIHGDHDESGSEQQVDEDESERDIGED